MKYSIMLLLSSLILLSTGCTGIEVSSKKTISQVENEMEQLEIKLINYQEELLNAEDIIVCHLFIII